MQNNFYDLNVSVPVEELGEAVELAKKLGWKGIGIITNENQLAGFRKETIRHKSKGFDIALGVLLEPARAGEVPKKAGKLRRSVELIAVKGGLPEVNRTALETPEVDLLLSPWSQDGCGLNHVLARLGKKNNVAVCFGFSELLYSYKKSRASLLSGMQEAAKLATKFGCPFALSGSAASPWELRAASELVSFGRVLGLRDPDMKKALSGQIIEENRKRLSGKWIMPGAELE